MVNSRKFNIITPLQNKTLGLIPYKLKMEREREGDFVVLLKN